MERSLKSILNNSNFQAELEKIAKESKRKLEDVQKDARNCIEELYSQQHPVANIISSKGSELLLSRAYNNKIDIDTAEIKKLMNIMRQHSVAFILTHKTYLDTLVLLSTLARYGMPIPYSFGGINLAFPGLKQLGKNAGLIFLRRSFKDDKIYKASLRHYISQLIDNGDHLTWNIEGTRSRTGKIVYPQMGILKYIMEAEKQSAKPVKYIPVSIVYDLIPDVKEMTEQGKGKEKKSENLLEFFNYFQKLGNQYGKAAIRFGDPVDATEHHDAVIPDIGEDSYSKKYTLPRFAFELIHKANSITPVTTVSLVCNVLLNNFALTKKEIDFSVLKLMNYIERRKKNVLIDRGDRIQATVQKSLNLLKRAGIVQKFKAGYKVEYSLAPSEFLSAMYYANMASAHLYHRAFIEMALVKIKDDKSPDRLITFWKEIMNLRNLFKFEFFYTNKPQFSSEIEAELELFDPDWRNIITNPRKKIEKLLSNQKLFVSKGLLQIYVEANKIACHTLYRWDLEDAFNEEDFIQLCLFKGKELHWKSKINRLDSVSKPFLVSALRFAKNANLIPMNKKIDLEGLERWSETLEQLSERLEYLQELEYHLDKKGTKATTPKYVPGYEHPETHSKIDNNEEGPHIAAFFDLDRTLINDFSAKKFVQSRLLSGRSTAKELLLQFATILLYASGNRDFETLTKVSAFGLKGIKEKEFIKLGEEVFTNYLEPTIYPESRKLIQSHLDKGHRVVIISAATRYQIEPVAKELGIENIYCTELEVQRKAFTGIITEMCWNEGKARAGRKFAKENNIDLSKSFFYTDSFDDYPLLEIVGNPVATNPDNRLSQVAFENEWPILRFEDTTKKPLVNGVRTVLAGASIYPSAVKGIARGLVTMNKKEAANTTFSSVGDLGTRLAGLDINIKGKQNLEDYRPAVFCFNHQSSADFFILLKILRKDITGVAKKELEYSPIGPIFKALGAIFVDRSNREKAIKALKPAVDALKDGTSIVIAPEGTRSGSKQLGKFKKGAFHLAMKAGVPIIPIVIKNAYMAMPKGSNFFKPTHIEVVVLDPVDTSGWKPKNIDTYVEEVRNLFLEELEN